MLNYLYQRIWMIWFWLYLVLNLTEQSRKLQSTVLEWLSYIRFLNIERTFYAAYFRDGLEIYLFELFFKYKIKKNS